MHVLFRELNDPLNVQKGEAKGALNIIDLANLDSCAFIATDDQGVGYHDGRFQVLGRIDGSEQRGCNLVYSDIIESR